MICTSARFIECSRDEVRRGHRVEVPGVFAVSYADQVHRFLFMFFFPFLCCDFFFTGKCRVCLFCFYRMALKYSLG